MHSKVLDILGFISLLSTIIAGNLVISLNLRIKLMGVCAYFISNIYVFLLWKEYRLNNFLVNAIIFFILNIVNICRIKKQIKCTTKEEYMKKTLHYYVVKVLKKIYPTLFERYYSEYKKVKREK